MLLFVKLVVWQHLAEGLGCRQGPLKLGSNFGCFGLILIIVYSGRFATTRACTSSS